MDDIFYFTKNRIGLNCITGVIRQFHPFRMIASESGLSIQVSPSPPSRSHWAPFNFSETSPEEARELTAAGIKSGFTISHHRAGYLELSPILRSLLEQYDGWVGHDSDGFWPRFSLDTLDDFKYPD